jgi:FixJ family two-component response regulator
LEGDVADKPVIAIVDDDESVREGALDCFKAMGFGAIAYPSALDFLNSSQLSSVSCLITDVHMPAMTGFELRDRLVSAGYTIPIILITAYPSEQDRSRALAAGVVRYVTKPFSFNDLIASVRSVLEHSVNERKS